MCDPQHQQWLHVHVRVGILTGSDDRDAALLVPPWSTQSYTRVCTNTHSYDITAGLMLLVVYVRLRDSIILPMGQTSVELQSCLPKMARQLRAYATRSRESIPPQMNDGPHSAPYGCRVCFVKKGPYFRKAVRWKPPLSARRVREACQNGYVHWFHWRSPPSRTAGVDDDGPPIVGPNKKCHTHLMKISGAGICRCTTIPQ